MLETRHTEKSILFMLLKAQKSDPVLAESRSFREIVSQLEATMEPEDVQLVLKKISDLG